MFEYETLWSSVGTDFGSVMLIAAGVNTESFQANGLLTVEGHWNLLELLFKPSLLKAVRSISIVA